MTADPHQSLTEPQREAVLHVDGPLLVLAGPGSGKTRVITHRIAHLLSQGVRPSQIAALTFTNKAADEMRLRLNRLAPGENVWIGTFHRFCARLLRQYAEYRGLQPNYTIYDTSDSLSLLKRTIRETDVQLTHATPEQVAAAISWAKNHLIEASRYVGGVNATGSIVERVYPKYQAALQQANAVDFDDLLMHVTLLLKENEELRASLDERFRYILVDEYQDTNLPQYAIVRAMSIQYPNLGVTGDPDQSIYGWRGANLKNILEFESDFPTVKVVRLEQNYRSTPNILSVADALIANNKQRKKKSLFTDNPAGKAVRMIQYSTHKEEAQAIAARISAQVAQGKRRPRDYAIFYRINALSRTFEDAMRQQGVPYMIVSGVEFYHRKEIKDLLAYALLMNNPRDDVAFERIVNVPKRAIGKATLLKLRIHAAAEGLSMLEAAREAGMIDGLGNRAAVALAKFVALFDRLSTKINDPVEEILGFVLSESEFKRQYEATDDVEDQTRLENIEELLSSAREYDIEHPHDGTLEHYLEEKTLVNETDDFDAEMDRVTLMTLHAAKGLEFPVVHIVALEQGLLPHERSRENPEQLEEERRLLFVGITRAEEELDLSMARYRDFRGKRNMTIPSPFLMELPRDEMEVTEEQTAFAPDFPLEESFFPEFPISGQRSLDLPRPALPSAVTNIRTAADLLGEREGDAQPRVEPNSFVQGMVVTHDEYGLGKIIALSGEGAKRTATVRFASGAGEKKFRLAYSPLRPANSSRP
ncbi:UvrD-helicase domain-containing protein [Blastopirellula sp. J2-11]|uniref:ATP-dependent helicase n=1 Tax=Blastopirellula sp. J2-11 TaxID=2943192 RepID=UPI0021C6633D|nr:UvrD-helicase domain-containing protein [Blastopirellula sp. J2-11]UUO05373.1 UvrD-helicase domain-containing protein [Blastopirellula sp. J2-11]